MREAVSEGFEAVFEHRPEAESSAPGRVNLLGEHTDYHEGFVLPTTIPQRTHAAVSGRTDRRVRVWSGTVPAPVIEEYTLGAETPGRGWLDYVQGVTVALAGTGISLPGFDLYLDSAVPVGSGLSSSAALEISVLRALRTRFALPLDDVAVAHAGWKAETDFVGAPVGIMDQMASSLGVDGEVLFLDTRTLRVQPIPLSRDIDLIVIDSGVTHHHAGGEYAVRRQQSFDAAAALGVAFLRDAGLEALSRLGTLHTLLERRARHVITENNRVLDGVAALRTSALHTFGDLMNESHASMRDDFDISTPDIDALVEIAWQHDEVYGARLTGGGFGGSIVAISRAGTASAVAGHIVRAYRARTGRHATVLVAGYAS